MSIQKTLKKAVKAVILLPLWPLIWGQLGFKLNPFNCKTCAGCGNCCERARRLAWWYQR